MIIQVSYRAQSTERCGKELTVEEPSSGVISNDTKSDGMHRGDLDRVTTHGVSLTLNEWRVQSWVVRSIVLCPSNELHLVSVQMAVEEIGKG